MVSKRIFKKFDDRTGRLERALDLVEDAHRKGVMTIRAEADRPHPQSVMRRIPPDRVQLKGGGFTPEIIKGRYVWMVGWQGTSNFDRPQSPAIVQGYDYARYIYATDVAGGGFGEMGFGFFGFGGVREEGTAEGVDI